MQNERSLGGHSTKRQFGTRKQILKRWLTTIWMPMLVGLLQVQDGRKILKFLRQKLIELCDTHTYIILLGLMLFNSTHCDDLFLVIYLFHLFVMWKLTLWFPVMGWIKCSVLSTRFAQSCYSGFYLHKRVQQFDNGNLHRAVTTGFTRRRECSSLTTAICTVRLQRVLPAGENAAAWQWRRGRSRGGRERWPAGSLPPPRPSAGRRQTRGCSGTRTRLETS